MLFLLTLWRSRDVSEIPEDNCRRCYEVMDYIQEATNAESSWWIVTAFLAPVCDGIAGNAVENCKSKVIEYVPYMFERLRLFLEEYSLCEDLLLCPPRISKKDFPVRNPHQSM